MSHNVHVKRKHTETQKRHFGINLAAGELNFKKNLVLNR